MRQTMSQTPMTTKSQTQVQVNGLLRAAAVAAALIIGGTEAGAQYRSGNDGRALDANNRVGSGGSNRESTGGGGGGPTGNQIVTGNVTSGPGVPGPVGYTPPPGVRPGTRVSSPGRFFRNSSRG